MTDNRTLRIGITGDSNIGLFCVATDRFCLVPRTVTEKQSSDIEKVLGVGVHMISVGYTSFIGIFLAGNSNGIVASSLIEDGERKKLESDLGVNVSVLESRFNTAGNLIAANDKGAVISPLFNAKQKKSIEECLGVEALAAPIAGSLVTGSACLVNNKGALLHRDANEKEAAAVESALKIRAAAGTLGIGSPWVGAGGVCNSNGMVVGRSTTIHEIVRADEALGFV